MLTLLTMERNSIQNSIKFCLSGKGWSSSTPSVSPSGVPGGNSMKAIVPVVAVVMAVFLVLLMLLVAGITTTHLLRQKLKSKTKPTATKCACYITSSVLITADKSTLCHADTQGETGSRSSETK